MSQTRCGFVALVGQPNVGKSTLLNALLGSKVSIVTPRAQTTRHRVIGVLTRDRVQYVFVDTPGVHTTARRALNRRMNEAARYAADEADVAVVLVAAPRIGEEDHRIVERMLEGGKPVIVVVNQIDRLASRSDVLPLLEQLARRHPQVAEFVPLSALRGDNLEPLLAVLASRLPESPFLYPPEMITDQTQAQRIAEVVREKLTMRLREELPYGLAVGVEQMATDESGLLRVHAAIWVEQERHKAIVIGKGGLLLKDAGSSARRELQKMFGCRVHLELWVKVREDWPDDERALDELGYHP